MCSSQLRPQNPDYLDASLLEDSDSDKTVHIQTLIHHLDKEYKGTIEDDYDELSEHVHPNGASLMSNTSMKDEDTAMFAARSGSFSKKEIEAAIRTLIEANRIILDKLRKIGFIPYRFNFLKRQLDGYDLEWNIGEEGNFQLEEV